MISNEAVAITLLAVLWLNGRVGGFEINRAIRFTRFARERVAGLSAGPRFRALALNYHLL
jgi:hypothetical protein